MRLQYRPARFRPSLLNLSIREENFLRSLISIVRCFNFSFLIINLTVTLKVSSRVAVLTLPPVVVSMLDPLLGCLT